MKKIMNATYLLACLCLAFVSCKKDGSGQQSVITCTGGNLCFTLNGQDLVFNTRVEQMTTNKFRIVTTDAASGNDWKRVELYFFGDGTAGDYTFDYTAAANTASMVYFGKEGGVSFQYMTDNSGTVKLQSVANGKWTGTFSGTMLKQGGTGTYSLQNGKFADVGN